MFDMGERLKELRKAKGLSIAALAKKIHVGDSTIQRYENNTQMLTAENITNLSLLYNVSTDYILGLDHRKEIIVADLTPDQIRIINEFVDELKDKNK